MFLSYSALLNRRLRDFWSGPGSLVLGLACLVAAVSLYFLLDHRNKEPALAVLQGSLQQQIRDRVAEAEIHNQRALDYIHQVVLEAKSNKKTLRISREMLNGLATTPSMLLIDGKLWHWTDAHIVPPEQSMVERFKHRLVWQRNMRYLMIKTEDTIGPTIYSVVSVVPIFHRFSISNKYLVSGWTFTAFNYLGATVNRLSDQQSIVTLADGTFLFSVFLASEHGYTPDNARYIMLILLSMAVVLLSWWLCRLVLQTLVARKQIVLGLAVLVACFGSLRLLMFWAGFPSTMLTTTLFDNTIVNAELPPLSLGDLAVNLLIGALLLGYVFRYLFASSAYDKLRHRPAIVRLFQSVLIVLAGYAAQLAMMIGSQLLFSDSTWTLDLNATLSISFWRILALVVFLLFATNYFLFSHTLVRLYLKINGYDQPIIYGAAAIATLVYGSTYWFYRSIFHWYAIPLLLGYYIIVIRFKLPKYVAEQRYQTFIYYFLCAAVCAISAGLAQRELVREKSISAKHQFANQLLNDNDAIAEQLLHQMRDKITQDDFILNRMIDPFSNKELVIQKIQRAHLDPYFNKYDINITLYNSVGAALEQQDAPSGEYAKLLSTYNKPTYATPYPRLYFLNELNRNVFKRYLCFVPLVKDSVEVGSIVLDVKLKRISQSTVYPQLLVDRRQGSALQNRVYSYAIFADQDLIYAFGSQNYDRNFDRSLLQDPNFYTIGVENDNGQHHLGVIGADKKTVVVTSVLFPIKQLINAFAFLFFILISYILTLVLGYFIYLRYQNTQMLLSTKIQLFLNAAFFLPLLLATILILSVIGNSYRDDLYTSFIKHTEDAVNNLGPDVQQYLQGSLALNSLTDQIGQVSRNTGQDINLFGIDGRLISTSQPSIYEKQLLEPYINPRAWSQLLENRQANTLETEYVGRLTFKSAYVPVFHNETGKPIAILSIPYFDSGSELNHQITDVVFSLLRIFTAVFLIFLALSYYVSQQLVVPLKLITNRLRRTSLQSNTRLEWRTRDEIGLLINEYNKMLLKLEASREALSASEKESAWREMAQQVAHEIKNPLTPMKLTLQYLQKAIDSNNPNVPNLLDRSIKTLLTQVENLNDIATSFSTFAKMPVPKNEVFDVAQVLRNTTNLYQTDTEHDLQMEIQPGHFWVQADNRLMSRIFTNLVLNALQAVPDDRRAKLRISLATTPQSTVIITFSDNGNGIPDDIRSKVFIPNFSTKSGGSGIGLAVAKRGINHAGGSITFRTTQGQGTTFFVELPLVENPDAGGQMYE